MLALAPGVPDVKAETVLDLQLAQKAFLFPAGHVCWMARQAKPAGAGLTTKVTLLPHTMPWKHCRGELLVLRVLGRTALLQ